MSKKSRTKFLVFSSFAFILLSCSGEVSEQTNEDSGPENSVIVEADIEAPPGPSPHSSFFQQH